MSGEVVGGKQTSPDLTSRALTRLAAVGYRLYPGYCKVPILPHVPAQGFASFQDGRMKDESSKAGTGRLKMHEIEI